MSSSNSTP
jgi:hypothetical protein